MSRKKLQPRADRGPLRAMFTITSMPVGGAETLLVNLIRRIDRNRILPEVCCLKEKGPLGTELAEEIPVHCSMLGGKYDVGVHAKLKKLLIDQRIDALITVGAGDKMFWGRLAAWRSRVPVIASALHSTGWPDSVGRLNRLLTPVTDAFIGVADAHGEHLVANEGFPQDKVSVIPNGIDTIRFSASQSKRDLRKQLTGIDNDVPLCVIVAALRPEKNHSLYLRMAQAVRKQVPNAEFAIVGDGPERPMLEQLASELDIESAVHFLGTRHDIDQILPACDAFALTSNNEASPVSIMEAMACNLPVIATRVGSVPEMVEHDTTGFLFDVGDVDAAATHMSRLLSDRQLAETMGEQGREKVVRCGSLETMVDGYMDLIESIYDRKAETGQNGRSANAAQSDQAKLSSTS